MHFEILSDVDAVARQAAAHIAQVAREDATAKGHFVLAVSGGRTPWQMLRQLANEEVPWDAIQIVQVDERIAPAGSPARNLTHLRESLLEHARLREDQIHPMPVEMDDLPQAASEYAANLARLCGSPPAIDLVHLGLGPDGHTASLVPNDSILSVRDRDVALTGTPYQGYRRMTLTYPVLNRARRILWLVTGTDKAAALVQLRNQSSSIPAGTINQQQATLLADRDAAKLLT